MELLIWLNAGSLITQNAAAAANSSRRKKEKKFVLTSLRFELESSLSLGSIHLYTQPSYHLCAAVSVHDVYAAVISPIRSRSSTTSTTSTTSTASLVLHIVCVCDAMKFALYVILTIYRYL